MGFNYNFMKNEKIEEIIKKATSRFLGWKLPDTFNPDGGISYDHRGDVIGTHLFTAQEAELMVRYILEDSTLVELIKDARKQLLDEIMEEIDKTSQLITIFRGFSEKSERIIYQSDMKNLIKSKY